MLTTTTARVAPFCAPDDDDAHALLVYRSVRVELARAFALRLTAEAAASGGPAVAVRLTDGYRAFSLATHFRWLHALVEPLLGPARARAWLEAVTREYDAKLPTSAARGGRAFSTAEFAMHEVRPLRASCAARRARAA